MSSLELKNFWVWPLEEALVTPAYWYVLLIFIFLILTLWSLRKLKRDLVSVFSDDDGKVQITPHALQELVETSCENIDGIYSPNSSIRKRVDGIRLDVRLKVRPDCDIKKIRSILKMKLEEIIVKNLNFENFSGVDIVIKGFSNPGKT